MRLIFIIIQFLCGAFLIYFDYKLQSISDAVFFILGLFFCLDASNNFKEYYENR